MKNTMSSFSKISLILAAIFLIISLFVPIWSISLDAPQYPEGLGLQIWAGKIAGDVDIINGLNHYIGMKTLHTDDFVEFKILPYLISFFALLFIVAVLVGKKKWLYIVFTAFVLFGIIAMVDFWKWEYDYGHNLDPNAAIKVPGMAYQPPLIGFKQLLNFGAYSIPATGGWLFVGAGLLLLISTLKEKNMFSRVKKNKAAGIATLFMIFMLSSCGSNGPQPVFLNKDACEFCKMTIADGRFMTQLVTQKGRVYKFDDLNCMLRYSTALNKTAVENFYVGNYEKQNELIDAGKAWYVADSSFKSPMGGNTAAFANKESAAAQAAKYKTNSIDWATLNNKIAQKEDSHDGHQH